MQIVKLVFKILAKIPPVLWDNLFYEIIIDYIVLLFFNYENNDSPNSSLKLQSTIFNLIKFALNNETPNYLAKLKLDI